jgi:prolyl-tRNA editing enzyme YbaK/EbsC (Cys-tRNA(Pro) deacylase)
MAMEQARAYLKQYHKEQDILVLDASSATVEQAAQALGTQPERIAKSLSFMVREHAVIVVAAGDCRVDNHAYKETFGCKAKMLKGDEVESCHRRCMPVWCTCEYPHISGCFFKAV